jgi:cell division protein FtsW (lipid II flippase)
MFRKADFLLLGVALGLSLFGLAMIASVSVYQSYQLTQRFVESGTWEAPSNSFYLWRSFVHMLAALIGLGFTSIVPYHFWQKHARTLFLINMALLLTLYISAMSTAQHAAGFT